MADEKSDKSADPLEAYNDDSRNAEYGGALDHLKAIVNPRPQTLEEMKDRTDHLPQTLKELRERVSGVADALEVVVRRNGKPYSDGGYDWEFLLDDRRAIRATLNDEGLFIAGYRSGTAQLIDHQDYQIGFPGNPPKDGLIRSSTEFPSIAFDSRNVPDGRFIKGEPPPDLCDVPAYHPVNAAVIQRYFNVLQRAGRDILSGVKPTEEPQEGI